MSLTIDTTPELEARLHEEAVRHGMDTTSYALSLLEKGTAPTETLPRTKLTPEQQTAARAKLLKYAGSFRSGDPHSANNERIDADLAAEYGRGLDTEV